jgi:hypothetical protein
VDANGCRRGVEIGLQHTLSQFGGLSFAVEPPEHYVVVLHGVNLATLAFSAHTQLEVPVRLFVDSLDCGACGFKVFQEGCVECTMEKVYESLSIPRARLGAVVNVDLDRNIQDLRRMAV